MLEWERKLWEKTRTEERERCEGRKVLGDMVDILWFDDGFDIIFQNLGEIILQLRPSVMPKNHKMENKTIKEIFIPIKL